MQHRYILITPSASEHWSLRSFFLINLFSVQIQSKVTDVSTIFAHHLQVEILWHCGYISILTVTEVLYVFCDPNHGVDTKQFQLFFTKLMDKYVTTVFPKDWIWVRQFVNITWIGRNLSTKSVSECVGLSSTQSHRSVFDVKLLQVSKAETNRICWSRLIVIVLTLPIAHIWAMGVILLPLTCVINSRTYGSAKYIYVRFR